MPIILFAGGDGGVGPRRGSDALFNLGHELSEIQRGIYLKLPIPENRIAHRDRPDLGLYLRRQTCEDGKRPVALGIPRGLEPTRLLAVADPLDGLMAILPTDPADLPPHLRIRDIRRDLRFAADHT